MIDFEKLNDQEVYGDFKIRMLAIINKESTSSKDFYCAKTKAIHIIKLLSSIYGSGINAHLTNNKAKRILKYLSACKSVSAESIKYCSEMAGNTPTSIEVRQLKNKLGDHEYNSLTKRDTKKYEHETIVTIALSKNFYQSREWKSVRYQAFRIYKNYCHCCGRKAGETVQLQADHIKPRSLSPELALDVSNIQILCMDCNSGKSNLDCTNWRD